MRSHATEIRGRGAAVVIALLLHGCAGSPSVRDADDISVRLYDDADYDLDLVNTNDPDKTPAQLAMQGASGGIKECVSIDHPFAIILAPVCGAIGAGAGAVAGSALSRNLLPEDEADELVDATRLASRGVQLQPQLKAQLEQEGRARQHTIVEYPDGAATLHVVIENLEWHVVVGNQVAIRGKFLVAVGADGDYDRRGFTRTSPYLDVADWTADAGSRITGELAKFVHQASATVWEIVDE